MSKKTMVIFLAVQVLVWALYTVSWWYDRQQINCLQRNVSLLEEQRQGPLERCL